MTFHSYEWEIYWDNFINELFASCFVSELAEEWGVSGSKYFKLSSYFSHVLHCSQDKTPTCAQHGGLHLWQDRRHSPPDKLTMAIVDGSLANSLANKLRVKTLSSLSTLTRHMFHQNSTASCSTAVFYAAPRCRSVKVPVVSEWRCRVVSSAHASL